MNEIYFAHLNNLKVGDRLIRNKGVFSTHHGIYAGIHNGVPLVAENQQGVGVHYVALSGFLRNDARNLIRIEPFKGNEIQRLNVIPRINQLVGSDYDLINFNCEHFAELIQNGRSTSRQLNLALFGLGVVVLAAILAD